MIAEGVEGKAGFIRGLRARPLTAFDHMTPRGHSGRVHEVVSYATLRLARFRVRWNSRACEGHPLREWAPSRTVKRRISNERYGKIIAATKKRWRLAKAARQAVVWQKVRPRTIIVHTRRTS